MIKQSDAPKLDIDPSVATLGLILAPGLVFGL
jgi:hypothetical protein